MKMTDVLNVPFYGYDWVQATASTIWKGRLMYVAVGTAYLAISILGVAALVLVVTERVLASAAVRSHQPGDVEEEWTPELTQQIEKTRLLQQTWTEPKGDPVWAQRCLAIQGFIGGLFPFIQKTEEGFLFHNQLQPILDALQDNPSETYTQYQTYKEVEKLIFKFEGNKFYESLKRRQEKVSGLNTENFFNVKKSEQNSYDQDKSNLFTLIQLKSFGESTVSVVAINTHLTNIKEKLTRDLSEKSFAQNEEFLRVARNFLDLISQSSSPEDLSVQKLQKIAFELLDLDVLRQQVLANSFSPSNLV